MSKPELIAPAGSPEKLKYALEYGADAIYLGIPDFSMRYRINKFDLSSLKQGIEYAHAKRKKAYVTLNIYGHNEHIKKLPSHIKKLKKYGADALIISDPGIFRIAKKVWPRARIHLSTQANVTNWQAAKFWYDQGVKRMVLARECTLDEIKEIHQKAPKLELEYFVHGAMCMSYSGRCILSKYFTGKSANLGDCTQPCRWQYNIYLEEAKRQGEYLSFEEDAHGTYILNSKDLCLIKHLDELRQAGISAFKIEGRAKSVYYVSAIVKAYKQAMNQSKVQSLKSKVTELSRLFKEIHKTANRGFTTGFLFGKDKFENKIDSSHSECDWMFVGTVVGVKNLSVSGGKNKSKYLINVKVHNALKTGDTVEIVQPKADNIRLKIKQMIDIKTDKEVAKAHGGAGAIIRIKSNKSVEVMSLLRKRLI